MNERNDGKAGHRGRRRHCQTQQVHECSPSEPVPLRSHSAGPVRRIPAFSPRVWLCIEACGEHADLEDMVRQPPPVVNHGLDWRGAQSCRIVHVGCLSPMWVTVVSGHPFSPNFQLFGSNA